MTGRRLRIAVYGDMNLNFIDGSAIWLQSLVEMLHADRRNEVSVLLKAKETRDLLTAPIRALPRARVFEASESIESPDWGMSAREALARLEALDAGRRFDVLILRGLRLVREACERGAFDGRLWPYLTDIPQSFAGMDPNEIGVLQKIARSSRYVLCQTEELRAHLESFVQEICGKAILLTPMIPDAATSPRQARSGPFRLVYAGKFAPLWNTLEMADLITALRAHHPDAELHMIGDKIHVDREQPEFYERMKRALESTEGLVWHGALPRQKVPEVLREADLALGWRHPALDESLELSTKILEYGQAGLPVLLNRTPMHERLLGADYPFFASDAPSALEAVLRGIDRAAIYREARVRTSAMAEGFTVSHVYDRLKPYLERVLPPMGARAPFRPLRVVAACHDWKFFTRIVEHLESVEGIEVRRDEWAELRQHDVKKSRELLEWADVILCEWCGGNAIWYSRNKKRHQRLYVRLHRFELYGRYPEEVTLPAVDGVILVSEHYRALVRERLDWPSEKLTIIPNWVDTQQLDRPKRSGAMFNLGLLGIVPSRKRFDRAVHILRLLREKDDRYLLFVKSKMPWEYPWHWREAEEREHFVAAFRALNACSMTRDAVIFDDFGPDVPLWMTKIGYVLSTSDDESFHLAPAEGMASRALPMLLDWAGADKIYESKWIHQTEQEVADHIDEINTDPDAWPTLGEECRETIELSFSVDGVCRAWTELVVDGRFPVG